MRRNPSYPGLASDIDTQDVEAGYVDAAGMFGLGQSLAALVQKRQQTSRDREYLRKKLKLAIGRKRKLASKLAALRANNNKVPDPVMVSGPAKPAPWWSTPWWSTPPSWWNAPQPIATPIPVPSDPSITPPVSVAPLAPVVAPIPTSPAVALPVPADPPLPVRPAVVPQTATSSGAGWIWSGYDGNDPAIKAYLDGRTRSFGFGPDSWNWAMAWISKGGMDGLGHWRTRASRRTSIWA